VLVVGELAVDPWMTVAQAGDQGLTSGESCLYPGEFGFGARELGFGLLEALVEGGDRTCGLLAIVDLGVADVVAPMVVAVAGAWTPVAPTAVDFRPSAGRRW